MELKEAVWQIKDFTEEAQKRYEEETSVKESVHHSTVDKWFKDLESKDIHHIHRTAVNNKKIYDELDVTIAIFIMKKRAQKWSLDAIYNVIAANFEVRSFPDLKQGEELKPNNELLTEEMSHIFEKMQKQFEEKMIQELDIKKKELEQQVLNRLPGPKTVLDVRAEKTDNMILSVRKRYEIEGLAIAEWNMLPLERKVKKVGFFRREEDMLKRDDFIREYVKNYFENEDS